MTIRLVIELSIQPGQKTCTGCNALGESISKIPMCLIFRERLTSDDQRHDGGPMRCFQCSTLEHP